MKFLLRPWCWIVKHTFIITPMGAGHAHIRCIRCGLEKAA